MNHILGEFVGVVRHNVEFKLDGLVLLVLVAPLLGIQHAQPELDALVVAGNHLVPRDDFHFQSRLFGKELVVQQVLDTRPIKKMKERQTTTPTRQLAGPIKIDGM